MSFQLKTVGNLQIFGAPLAVALSFRTLTCKL